MCIDILEGSERLASAVDFTAKFEGFDKAVLDAGVEQLKIAHFQNSIDANKLFINAFDDEGRLKTQPD